MSADENSLPCVHRGPAVGTRRGEPVHRCVARGMCVLHGPSDMACCDACPQRRSLPSAGDAAATVRLAGTAEPQVWSCPHRSPAPVAEVTCTACGRQGQVEPVYDCALHGCRCTIRRHARHSQSERVCQSCPDRRRRG